MSLLSQKTISKKVSISGVGIHTGINLNSLLDFCNFIKDWFPHEKLEGKMSKAGLPVGF